MDGSENKRLPESNRGFLEILRRLRILPNEDDLRGMVEYIAGLKARSPGSQNRRLAESLIGQRSKRAGTAGAVAALPGAFPGIGTLAQLGIAGTTFTGEVWYLLKQISFLHYEIAACYEQDLFREEVLHDLLLAWGLTTGAVIPAREATKRVGSRVFVSQFDKRVPGSWLRILNKKLATTVFTKFGTKRGAIALGKLIPLGVGVGINAAANYFTIRGFGRSSLRIYEEEEVFIENL